MEACDLMQKQCKPCEGGVPPLSETEVQEHLCATPLWGVDQERQQIERRWKFADFVTAMTFLQQVAEVAEQEQHHPDLHLTGYRHVKIVLTTHAIGGLSENDFIVAAKLDALEDNAS